MVYLNHKQTITIVNSHDAFQELCLEFINKCSPLSDQWSNDIKESFIDSKHADSFYKTSNTETNDESNNAVIALKKDKTYQDLSDYKQFLNKKFTQRLMVYNPELYAKPSARLPKSTQILKKGFIGNVNSGNVKEMMEKKLFLKRQLLKKDFLKFKKYTTDHRQLLMIYKKYKIPLQKFISIQLSELTRQAITETFEKIFINKTVKNTFFSNKPPFMASTVLLNAQQKFLKNMYIISYDDNHKKNIEASASMNLLTTNMYGLFTDLFKSVLETFSTNTAFVSNSIRLANTYASSINNISPKRNYNSLEMLLHLIMIIHNMSFSNMIDWLSNTRRINFMMNSGFLDDEVSLQELIESEFFFLKPMEKIYNFLNPNTKFEYNEPLNILCTSNKCHDDIIPGLYAEFCLLRLITILVKEKECYLNRVILQTLKKMLENWDV